MSNPLTEEDRLRIISTDNLFSGTPEPIRRRLTIQDRLNRHKEMAKKTPKWDTRTPEEIEEFNIKIKARFAKRKAEKAQAAYA